MLLIVYFVAGKFGLSFFALIHPSASAVWLPTGIALAALLLGGLRLVPAVFVGAFLVNVTTAGSIPTSLGIALGNTLEGVLAVTLVERFAGGRQAFTSAAGILKFMALAAFLSTTVSATIGVASLTLGGYAADEDSRAIWFTWWLGDAAGAVVVTPLLSYGGRTDRGVGGAQGGGGAVAVRGDRRDRRRDVLSSRALAISARVSLPRAARVGSAALRAARDRDGHCGARDRRDDGDGDRPRPIRDVDAERVAARAASVPHHDLDDGAADGCADRRASRVARARARGTR